tara:strand:- start:1395 stop:1889 length:495 start_codon:yes stop_codon:yes gene_type:complete
LIDLSVKKFRLNTLILFLFLLFSNCTSNSTEGEKHIFYVNQKLLSEESYTSSNFTFNTPKGWVLVNPKDSINLVFLSPIDSSMMLVNITNKFDPMGFSKPQYAEFTNNGINFQQNVYQNSIAVVFDIKIKKNNDSLSLYYAVPRIRMNENMTNIESSMGSLRFD